MKSNKKYYAKLIADSEIGKIALELMPDRITTETPNILHCDCPNHVSESGKSLQINLNNQLWYCFGCNEGGNVLHLVEFIKTGKVTKGTSGPQSDSHRMARDYLAQRANIPLLSPSEFTPEEIQDIELKHSLCSTTFRCLTAIADYYHKKLNLNEEALDWIFRNYAISKAIIKDLMIGFSDNTGILEELADAGFTTEDILSTGAFLKSSYNPSPLFNNRITFPYWSRGKGVVYMIGRKTPWSPNNEYESGKYKKLLVHSEKYPYVRECINNSVLFNEDCLIQKPSTIIITEGITDAISLMDREFSVISPVTVRLKETDQQRLCEKLRNSSAKIVIVQDNEISRTGQKGALDTAKVLCDYGVDARIAELPLSDKEEKSRQLLLEKYGIDEKTSAKKLKSKKNCLSQDSERKEIAKLIKDSKIDVNEYFLSGHSKEDFQKIIDSAISPLELAIAEINSGCNGLDLNRVLDPILLQISSLDPTQQDYYLRRIKNHLTDISLETLKKQLAKVISDNQAISEKEGTQFSKLLDLIIDSGSRVFIDQFQAGWITVKVKDYSKNIPIKSSKFTRVMLKMFYSAYHCPIAAETIDRVGMLLMEEASEQRYLYNRFAWLEDRLLIDMNNETWDAIEVSSDGWKIVRPEHPVFRRFHHQLPVVMPNRDGDVRKILKYLAITDKGAQSLILVWLCTCMFENIPRPGIILHGSHGGSKTSASIFLRKVVDPSTISTASLSRSHDEFIQLMDHHAVVCLDNLSSLPGWASDDLCRAVTGAGHTKRGLYSNDDDFTYHFRRVFILNGISIPSAAPDLLDRSILIQLTRIETQNRKTEKNLNKDFQSDLPDILGGILDVMVSVIARRDEKLEEYPRLADWYGLAVIASETLGIKAEFQKACFRSEKDQHIVILESHIESQILLTFMENRHSWEGPTGKLYDELTELAGDSKGKNLWPKNCSAWSKNLKKLYYNFGEMGFVIKDKTDGISRTISITKETKSGPDEETFLLSGDTLKSYGFPVSAVSAVRSNDITEIDLTADDQSAVSSGVTVADGLTPLTENKSEIFEMPEEVMAWPAHVQKIVRFTAEVNMETGMGREEAIVDAVDTVRSSYLDYSESK